MKIRTIYWLVALVGLDINDATSGYTPSKDTDSDFVSGTEDIKWLFRPACRYLVICMEPGTPYLP